MKIQQVVKSKNAKRERFRRVVLGAVMKKYGIDQKGLAIAAGVSPGGVSSFFSGKCESLNLAKRLAKVAGRPESEAYIAVGRIPPEQ